MHYPRPVSSNAANAMRNSSLARALRGDEDVAVSAARSSPPIQKAYAAIQSRANEKHRQINEAIMSVLEQQLGIELPGLDFEHEPFPASDRELRADVWCQPGDRPLAVEFTHRSSRSATPAVAASYVLQKIEDHARDYGLI
jgi:hypothetical protein